MSASPSEVLLAKLKFGFMMYSMFGGLPLTLAGVLFQIRDKFNLKNLSSAAAVYYMITKYAESPMGYDSNLWRKLGTWHMADLQRINGGGVLPPKKEFDQTKSYILAGAPHGVVAFTWALPFFHFNFGPEQKPSITLGARFLFKMPLVRDMMLMNAVEGSNENADYILQHGRSINVIPGGVPEMILAKPGKRNRVYTKNKGFVRLALRNGVSIIPIFAFGEQNVYAQKSFFEEFCQKRLGGFYPTIPWGSFGPFLPNDNAPLVYVFGEPVEIPKIENPTDEEVDYYHEAFYQAMHDLVVTRCEEAGFPDCEVEFVDKEHLNVRVPTKEEEMRAAAERKQQKKEHIAAAKASKTKARASRKATRLPPPPSTAPSGFRRGATQMHMARL